MNNQRKNLQDSINKAMNTPVENQDKPYVPEQISAEYVQPPQNDQPDTVAEVKKKHLLISY